MADENTKTLEDEGPPESDTELEGDPEANSHILAVLAEIQRLHRITSRDGEIERKGDLFEVHQDRARHHQRLRRSTSRLSSSQPPLEQRQGRPRRVGGGGGNTNCSLNRVSFLFGFFIILIICVGTPLVKKLFEHILGIRCFVPNNYLVWEATRPKSDCSFCMGYERPVILPNMTRQEFLVSRRDTLSLLFSFVSPLLSAMILITRSSVL